MGVFFLNTRKEKERKKANDGDRSLSVFVQHQAEQAVSFGGQGKII